MSLNLIITHNQWRSDRIGRVGKARGPPSTKENLFRKFIQLVQAPEYQGKFIQLVYRKDIRAVK
jgi:hypothetical protein